MLPDIKKYSYCCIFLLNGTVSIGYGDISIYSRLIISLSDQLLLQFDALSTNDALCGYISQ